MKTRTLRWAIIGLCALLVVGVAAQQTRKTHTGTLHFGQLVWDFAKNTIVVTGNPATLDIEGAHQAKLSSPRMEIDADQRLQEINTATASGPVDLLLVTAPDQEGMYRRIIAKCTDRAVYSRENDTVTMTGNVVADIVTLPEGQAEAAHLESESITVNLRTSTLTAQPGRFEVTTEIGNGAQ